jgi:hypothetical protein
LIPGPVIRPSPLPTVLTVMAVTPRNSAPTLVLVSTVSSQVGVLRPAQAPVQLMNLLPGAGTAVRLTPAPCCMSVAQTPSAPTAQSMAAPAWPPVIRPTGGRLDVPGGVVAATARR